jgi:putative spermidine/putrescine transport system ATP-binding protein
VLAEGEAAENVVEGRIISWAYLGAGFSLRIETAGLGEIRANLPTWRSAFAPAEGLPVRLGWPAEAAVPVAEDPA